MHLLLSCFILICLFISSFICQTNLTYVFTHLSIDTIDLVLNSNGLILTDESYVKHLSSQTLYLLNSTQELLQSDNPQSIVFNSNVTDCSFASAFALRFDSTKVTSPICFTSIPDEITNIYKLSITTAQLAQAAVVYMQYYSLKYFSVIMSLSNDFYYNLAQEFATYLSEKNYILEQFLFYPGFTGPSSSYRSKG